MQSLFKATLNAPQPPLTLECQWVGTPDTRAPLLVFLHEGLGCVAAWRDFPEQLCTALGVRGLVYSRYGYGQSTARPHDEAWQPDFMHREAHERLPALLDALHIHEPVHLLGHSDGGSIALLFAARYPERVASCAVMAPHLFVEPITLAGIRAARHAYEHGDLRAGLAKYHADVDSAFGGWCGGWLNPAFEAWNIEADIAPITCPVLAMQGVDDAYGTMAQIERIAARVPQTRLVKIDACGHSPHRDQPQGVMDAMRGWMPL